MNKGKKPLGKFIVTSSNPAVTLELFEETFDEMTFLVLLFVKRNNNFAIATGFNAGSRSQMSGFKSASREGATVTS